MADESGDAAGGAQEQFAGVGRDEVRRRGGGGEGVVQHGAEEGGVGGRGELDVGDDALGERGVLLEAEAAIEAEVADEPDGEVLAGVEIEASEAVELAQA